MKKGSREFIELCRQAGIRKLAIVNKGRHQKIVGRIGSERFVMPLSSSRPDRISHYMRSKLRRLTEASRFPSTAATATQEDGDE